MRLGFIRSSVDLAPRIASPVALPDWRVMERRLLNRGMDMPALGKPLVMRKLSIMDEMLLSQPALSQLGSNMTAEANSPLRLSLDSNSEVVGRPLCWSRQRRSTSVTDNKSRPLLGRKRSVQLDVGHAAAETYLVTRLAFKLLRYLGIGYRWLMKLAALYLYALLLMPGFIQVGWYYFFSKRVHRSITYGTSPRNRLDLYLPENTDNPKPVIAFVTGGAWIIGYKAWGSLLGQQFSERDVIVACIDYRNFPQGTISDMVADASQGISFICNNITKYGGDCNRIYLGGQSAGAHIAACALLEQVLKENGGGNTELTWSISQIKAFFGISGGYNLCKLVDHFHARGLYRSIFLSIMEGEDSLPHYSPEVVVQSPSFHGAACFLPPIHLFHGTADCSIPYKESTDFAESLLSIGAVVTSKLFPDKTHTDLFLQDPFRGGYDFLTACILKVVHEDDAEAQANDADAPPRRRMVPEILLQLAHKVSPF